MKKINVLMFVVLTIFSAFLLWLWYHLSFHEVDHPLDLLLSFLWWTIMIIVIYSVIRIERKRKERIRNVYVGDGQIFTSETGRVETVGEGNLVEFIAETLQNLKYDFNREDFPEKEEFESLCVIRTSKFKDDTWEGEVVDVKTKNEFPFKSEEELAELLKVELA